MGRGRTSFPATGRFRVVAPILERTGALGDWGKCPIDRTVRSAQRHWPIVTRKVAVLALTMLAWSAIVG